MTPTDERLLPGGTALRFPSLRAALARWEAAAFSPVDISFLVFFRVALGLLLAVSMERFLAYGWVDELLLAPSFRFKYFGFAWVAPLPREQLLSLFRVLVAMGLFVSIGFCFRVASLVLALGVSYVQLIDVSSYLNHYYLAALLAWILALSPAHRANSVDAWLGRWWSRRTGRAAIPERTQVAAGLLWLLRFQIGLVYFCAGLAKLQGDWLIHAQPLRIWLGASTDLPLIGPLFTWPGAPHVISWVGFAFDTSIVLWLSWDRTRPYAYAVVLFFHTLTRLLFDIGMFPWIMSACALIFFPPDSARRWIRALTARRRAPAASRESSVRSAGAAAPAPRSRQGFWLHSLFALGLVYATLQAVLPFRYLAYGGNVLWHEQGMRFSWRVMVRAKGGAVSFLVRRLDAAEPIVVEPKEYLTPFQENEMAGQPDLILQMAHHIGRSYEARGHGPVEVYARARVSLNGRRAAPLIDPSVDLMKVEDGLAPAPWILPAPAEAPPRIRPVL